MNDISLAQTELPVAIAMTLTVVSAAPTCSMQAIAHLMAEHQVGSVVVATSKGEPDAPRLIPVGIVTKRDLVQ